MTIIGSSSMFGGNRGPTGNPGFAGPRGPTGASGIATGNIGAPGVYIKQVKSDLDKNTITFFTSDGNSFTLNDFSGPVGNVANVSGVSAQISASNYFSVFSNVLDGTTVNFKGISAGDNVDIELSPDQSKIIVSTLTGGPSYNVNFLENYLVYTDGNTLEPTKIYSDTNDVLNFGLTGIPAGATTGYLYTTLNEEIVFVPAQAKNESGGITLDLPKSSNFWLETPIGITVFNAIPVSGIRQEYTLFINGSDVWNLPKNLYFENTEKGILNKSFFEGVNILHIWSENGGITFNGTIVERGIGSDQVDSLTKGSCCYSKYGSYFCDDLVNKNYCDLIGGVFQAMTTCFDRQGVGNCGTITSTNIRGETGACCCQSAGCIDDNTLSASGIRMTRSLCENTISGKFYPKQYCRPKDIGIAYGTRTFDGNTYNGPDGLICHKACIQPVACCYSINGTPYCSQETRWYCENVLNGNAIVNKTCEEVQVLGGCSDLTRQGCCTKYGECDNTRTDVYRYECIECGVWTTPENCCNIDLIQPYSVINVTTQNPQIRIVHSVGNVDDNFNVVTLYSQTDPIVNSLSFQVSEETGEKHTLYGDVTFVKDVTSPYSEKQYNIWDLNPSGGATSCFEITIKDEDGITLTADSEIYRNTNYYLQMTGKPTKCLDADFKAYLRLGVNSCSRGFTYSTASEPVPVFYTRSPCTCIATDSGDVRGDILNKAPFTIDWTAERFCLDCTQQYSINGILSHIPYPLKRQSGIITFCPPTENTVDNPISICTSAEGFCVSYGRIEELNGCTYSSLFDADNNGVIQNDTNTALDGCYHAEYNIPGAGTTYFYTGISDQNIRPCLSSCRIRTHYVGTNDELNSFGCQRVNCGCSPEDDCCKTKTSPQLSAINGCKTCAGNNNSVSNCDLTYTNPYYNKVNIDTNTLYYIAKRYKVDPSALEKNIISVIEKKNLLFDPNFIGINPSNPYGITSGDINVGGATIQRVIYYPGNPQGITINPNPDDEAKNSCGGTCSDFFNLYNKIRAPETNFTDYDVYGLYIEKDNICTVSEKNSSRNYKESNLDKKYYIVLKHVNDTCHLVYDIGTQTIVKSPILNLTSKFFNSVSSCSLDCSTANSIVKDIVWYGTISTVNTPDPTDRCQNSRILQYTIKKELKETKQAFENYTEYGLNDLISFTGLNTAGNSEAKKSSLKSYLSRLFKDNVNTNASKRCLICQNSGCYSDIVHGLTEFIGSSCDIRGLDIPYNGYTYIADPLVVPYNSTIKYKDISAGYYNTIGITYGGIGASGGVTGWGKNFNDMMSGFTATGITYFKVQAGANCVCGLKGYTYSLAGSTDKVKIIDSGRDHSAAILGDGSVIAWGDNTYGQCNVPSGIVATHIACGDYHTCAIIKNGIDIICWGRNDAGQCTVPPGITTINPWGGNYTIFTNCVAGLSFSGAVGAIPGAINDFYLWGNLKGLTTADPRLKINNNKMVLDSTTFTKFDDVSAGSNHILFVGFFNPLVGITVYGMNDKNQRTGYTSASTRYYSRNEGSGSGQNNATLTLTSINSWAAAEKNISAKGNNNIIKLNNTTKYYWLAWGETTTEVTTTSVTNVRDVAAGYNNFIWTNTSSPSKVNVVGNDTYGQRSVPSSLEISNTLTLNQISSGAGFVCAYDSKSKQLMCWGRSDGNRTNAPFIGEVGGDVAKTQLICSGDEDVAVTNPAEISIYGTPGLYPKLPNGVSGVKDFAVGYSHVVWINQDGGISFTSAANSPYMKGKYTAAMLGWNNSTTPKAKSVSCGKFHACAVLVDNGVTCWGDNTFQQCNVPTGLVADKVFCGGHHTVALLNDGSLRTWGLTAFGLNTVPSGTYKDVGAGYIHNCAINSVGGITCWGYTLDGQCKSPTSGVYTKISAGREHTVALDAAGGITCWGYVSPGQICGTFENKELITKNNISPQFQWFLEGTQRETDTQRADQFKILGFPRIPYVASVGANTNNEFTKLNNLFISDHFIGGISVGTNTIFYEKEIVKAPYKDVGFYFNYNIGNQTISTSTLKFYDIGLNFSGDPESRVTLKKVVPAINLDPIRDKITITNIKTYIKTERYGGGPGQEFKYIPIITFNVDKVTTTSGFKVNIYKSNGTTLDIINDEYNGIFSSGQYCFVQTNTMGDGNTWMVEYQNTPIFENTNQILSFNDKYIAAFSENTPSGCDIRSSIFYNPGFKNTNQLLYSYLSDAAILSMYTNTFDIKPLPNPDTGTQSTFLAPSQKRNINGLCMEIECSSVPEICFEYEVC